MNSNLRSPASTAFLGLSIALLSSQSILDREASAREIFAHEPEIQSQAKIKSSPAPADSSNHPWTLFGGIGTGYGVVSGQDFSESPQGGQLLFNGTLSYQATRWVLDGGIGWIYSNISGKNTANQSIQINTRAGLLELSPRYRISNSWQVGPILNVAFGTDTSFSSSVGQTSGTYFLGLKGVYEFHEGMFPIRIWSQISTDLTIQNQQAYLALLGIQIGIPFQRKQSVESTSGMQVAVTQKKPSSQVHILLDPQKVFFNSNSATLKVQTRKALEEIATYLQQNEKASTVEVDGHADQRGSYQYNFQLSKRRATAVKTALLSGNIDSSKLSLHAYSFLHPLDSSNTETAWAKNRRVELIFDRIENKELLLKKLRPLMTEGEWVTQESHEGSVRSSQGG